MIETLLPTPPTPPDRQDRSTFSGRMYNFFVWLSGLISTLSTWVGEVNSTAEDVDAAAAAAASSALTAAGHVTSAQTARTGAETARTGAETARTGAQSAQAAAEAAVATLPVGTINDTLTDTSHAWSSSHTAGEIDAALDGLSYGDINGAPVAGTGSGNYAAGDDERIRRWQIVVSEPDPEVGGFIICSEVPAALTIEKVRSHHVGGTNVTFDVEERTSLGSTGTDITSSQMTTTTSGTNTTSFSNAGIAAGAALYVRINGVSGSVTEFGLTITGKFDV